MPLHKLVIELVVCPVFQFNEYGGSPPDKIVKLEIPLQFAKQVLFVLAMVESIFKILGKFNVWVDGQRLLSKMFMV